MMEIVYNDIVFYDKKGGKDAKCYMGNFARRK